MPNKSENVAEVEMYVGKIVRNQNYIQQESKTKLNSGNASCHSV